MKKILILAFHPNYVDVRFLEQIIPDVERRFKCKVYAVPHHNIQAKPLYLVFNNFGVEHANKEKHQETKGSVDIQVPVLRRRVAGKKLDRR